MKKLLIVTMILLSWCWPATAQTTTFTYQGRLTDGASPANASYDLQFSLWDSASGGTQVGSTLTRAGVAVSNGIFTVQLDFGAGAFPGANRFLEIGVRPVGGGSYTTLAPRQPITSTPYAVQSLNSTQLGGVAANQYLQTNGNGSGLTDLNASNITSGTLNNARLGQIPTANLADSAVTAPKIALGQVVKSVNSLREDITLAAGSNITITPSGNTLTIAALGSANPILNQTAQQASANFNISGNGTLGGTLSANIVNSQTPIRLGGIQVLRAPGDGSNLGVGFDAGANTSVGTQNVFLGRLAGVSNISGSDNTYVGYGAGQQAAGNGNSFFGGAAGFNNAADGNSFFGRSAGFQNTTGDGNSFFGQQAGRDNTTGLDNSYFGRRAGIGNGNANSFFGANAGETNTGNFNAFFGASSGRSNTTGSLNAFFGLSSGFSNTTGERNSFFGTNAGTSNSTASDNTFFGYRAGVASTGAFNSFFGSGAGGSTDPSGCCNAFFGVQTGGSITSGNANVFLGNSAGNSTTSGSRNVFVGAVTGAGNVSGTSNTALGESADVGADNLTNATAIGADTIVTASNRVQLGRITQDTVAIGAFGTPSTSTHVCIDAFGVFTACSSSLRYKNNVKPLYTGLAFVRKLRPISFTWKGSGEHDIGFAAEDVAAVNEGFTFRNHKGEVEGVKYTQISAALVNAIKEQQAQIEALRATNAALNRRLRVLENRVLRRRRG